MYKHILVLVDSSNVSKKAGREAVELAASIGAVVDVVHIIDQKSSSTYERLERSGQAHINEVCNYADEHGVEHIKTLVHGDPKADIQTIAKKSGADLIVMGTRGKTGLRGMLGSFANFVLKNVELPVLIIRS